MIVDRIIPPNLLADGTTRFRARSLIFFSGIVGLGAFVLLLYVIAVDPHVSNRRQVSIVLVLLQILPILVVRKSGNLNLASWMSVLMLFALTEYVHFNNLGIQGPVSVGFILPPVLAALLIGGRAVLVVCVLTIIALFFNYYAQIQGWLPPPIMNMSNVDKLMLSILTITLLIITFLVYSLVRLTNERDQDLQQEVSKHKSTLDELIQAKEQAEASAKSKAMFLATMSHELRTPLNAVIGNAHLLNRQDLQPKARERVEDIQLAASLLLTLINDILDLSKFDSKGVELHPEPYDIAAQLHQLHHLMSSKIRAEVNFTLNVEKGPIIVDADQNRVAQILLNFLSNSAKFTEQGEISVDLAFNDQGYLVLSVKDTGKGISDEDQARLFEEFVQVGDVQNVHQEGTGLGLSIVERIVKAMDGSLEMESQLGVGTTMTVTFPIPKLEAEDIPEKTIVNEDQLDTDSFSAQRVMIVDDVKMNCVVLDALLRELGVIDITSVYSGQEAIDLIESNLEFDVILMDVRMPEMNGLEASSLIRNLGYQGAIIAVTANAFEDDKRACLDSGMDDFVSKPIDINILQSTLHKLEQKKPS